MSFFPSSSLLEFEDDDPEIGEPFSFVIETYVQVIFYLFNLLLFATALALYLVYRKE